MQIKQKACAIVCMVGLDETKVKLKQKAFTLLSLLFIGVWGGKVRGEGKNAYTLFNMFLFEGDFLVVSNVNTFFIWLFDFLSIKCVPMAVSGFLL